MNYKFVPFISLDQARAELVEMGNITGAEVNNYMMRLAIGHLAAGQTFPLLSQLEKYLVKKYAVMIRDYIGDCMTTGENCVYILRDKINMKRAVEAKYQGQKKFIGDCHRHGFCDHNVYGIQNINYKCSLCIQEKVDGDREPVEIIYNLDRNIMIRDFIVRNRMSLDQFSSGSKVMMPPLRRYLDCKETITGLHWMQMKSYIRGCLSSGDYTISKGLEFRTVFRHIIREMESKQNEKPR